MDGNRHDESENAPLEQARVTYQLPVTLEGQDADGAPFSEQTTAENVTRRGAFIATERTFAPGATLALNDAENSGDRLCEVQVVWVRVATGGVPGVGVKLLGPNDQWMAYLVAHSVNALEDDSPPMQ